MITRMTFCSGHVPVTVCVYDRVSIVASCSADAECVVSFSLVVRLVRWLAEIVHSDSCLNSLIEVEDLES